MKVLLAGDDPDLIDVTTYALRRYGYDIVTASDGVQALQRWRTEAPDLLLVDNDLPRVDGYQVCREVRRGGNTPVILLIAHQDENEVVQGFLEGADDCITKPFSQKELAMRIKAVLNRTQGWKAGPPAELTIGDLQLDLESHEVRRRGRETRLTPLEFRILYLLALNKGRVVSSARLAEYAWGYEAADTSMLKIYVSRIRKKLQLRSPSHTSIISVRWVGYRLNIEEQTLEGSQLGTDAGEADREEIEVEFPSTRPA